MNPELPIDEVLPELVSQLLHHQNAVLRAPPGAGKTTRVPVALLDQRVAGTGQIVLLEPRRIACRSAARRIAFERGERVGKSIGYRIRFEECVSADTRILVMTEGILLRRLQDDPFLEGIDIVIFDEFHERRLDSDLALAMCRRVQQTVRPDLRLVAMSATVNPAPIAAFLGQCPIIESAGRTFPVRIQYQRPTQKLPMSTLAAQGVEQMLGGTDGDILVFLPGVGEILKTQRELEPLAKRQQLLIMPLFGDMPADEQDRVLCPQPQRKVVLATNVAETSITIDGVTVVVDTGYVRQMQFDPGIGLDRLELQPISKASADQRAGRAGRTQPGVCLRLWEESSHRHRDEYDLPELHRIDLSSAVLRLHAWGEADVASFPWYECPSTAAIDHADRLLRMLQALDQSSVTELGQQMARLPVTPRIARLLIEGQRSRVTSRCTLLAALLSERDPFLRETAAGPRDPHAGGTVRTTTSRRSPSDVVDRLIAFERFQFARQPETPFGRVNPGAAKTIEQVASQLHRHLQENSHSKQPTADLSDADEGGDRALMRALVAAYPDRVTKRREAGSNKGLMVGGRGVQLSPRSSVADAMLFLSVDLDGKGTDAIVRQASEIQRDWLPPSSVRTTDDLFFHPSQKQVVARRRTWFEDLCLDETPVPISNSDECCDVLFQAARHQFASVFPTDNQELNSFLMRVRCLNQWMPDLQLPAFDATMLESILHELCAGRRSFSELRQAPWLAALQAHLSYVTQQRLDREAPERIQVPSGNRIRIDYEEGRPPILAVRIQEIFGWKQTPRIANGRIPLLLHLLAPNMRPQQITDDLASFWTNTYTEVRKELRRRYPKHLWPDDPANAEPAKKR